MHPSKADTQPLRRIQVVRPAMLENCLASERGILAQISRIFYLITFGLVAISALLCQTETSWLRAAGFSLIALGSAALVLGILTDWPGGIVRRSANDQSVRNE